MGLQCAVLQRCLEAGRPGGDRARHQAFTRHRQGDVSCLQVLEGQALFLPVLGQVGNGGGAGIIAGRVDVEVDGVEAERGINDRARCGGLQRKLALRLHVAEREGKIAELRLRLRNREAGIDAERQAVIETDERHAHPGQEVLCIGRFRRNAAVELHVTGQAQASRHDELSGLAGERDVGGRAALLQAAGVVDGKGELRGHAVEQASEVAFERARVGLVQFPADVGDGNGEIMLRVRRLDRTVVDADDHGLGRLGFRFGRHGIARLGFGRVLGVGGGEGEDRVDQLDAAETTPQKSERRGHADLPHHKRRHPLRGRTGEADIVEGDGKAVGK